MKTFNFYWKTGEVDSQEASSVDVAFSLLGYSGGAMGALDFYGTGEVDPNYQFSRESREWINVEVLFKFNDCLAKVTEWIPSKELQLMEDYQYIKLRSCNIGLAKNGTVACMY